MLSKMLEAQEIFKNTLLSCRRRAHSELAGVNIICCRLSQELIRKVLKVRAKIGTFSQFFQRFSNR